MLDDTNTSLVAQVGKTITVVQSHFRDGVLRSWGDRN
jgi:hypothetical protein